MVKKQKEFFKGKSLSPGYGAGKAFLYEPKKNIQAFKREIQPEHVFTETKRFEEALANSFEELEMLKKQVSAEIGDTEAGIFSAHIALLKDPVFVDKVKKHIEEKVVNAEHALLCEIDAMEKMLQALENEYIQERHQDIRDVGNRLLKHLKKPDISTGIQLKNLPSQTVIIAADLLPSDTIQLDRSNVKAIVTERSGAQSHATILARTLGIPFVTGVADITKRIKSGDWLQVDAEKGIIFFSPSPNKKKNFSYQKHIYDDILQNEIRDEHRDAVTKDGEKISLMANIGKIKEISAISRHHLKGVGLFRTEYLYLTNTTPPKLSFQTDIYRQMATQLEGAPLVIRTLDLGGDKHPAFLPKSFEDNPNLGLRGLRFSLSEQKLFKTQIKAILNAAKYGDVRIMFPMVTDHEDLHEAIKIVYDIAEKQKISKLPKIGSMIEIPSAVFAIDKILQLVDFVSIGTNDLTQFMLATDRNAIQMLDNFTTLHPMVMKAIFHVIEQAKTYNKHVSVCGEIAGEPTTACLLLGLGIKELSLSPYRASKVRHLIRKQEIKKLKSFADEALNNGDQETIKNILDKISLQKIS